MIDVLVIGAGPGGYAAAFRAADLGLSVVLVEAFSALGGVCLNMGCIPSKTLLHVAKVIEDAEALSAYGVSFAKPIIDIAALRQTKHTIVQKLAKGLQFLAKKRGVRVVTGVGSFTDQHTVMVNNEAISFKQAVIATGSQPIRLPFLPHDPRILDSTTALELPMTTGRLLIIGGGIIGVEMATFYAAMGISVTLAERGGQCIPNADPDLVRPLQERLKKQITLLFNTTVQSVIASAETLTATLDTLGTVNTETYDYVLCAVGRVPDTSLLNLPAAGVALDPAGFIMTDRSLRTNVAHIFAIGDVIGQPMLAHKAAHEGKIAAEVIAGHPYTFNPACIPSVAYTDPEVAWVGVTETEAKQAQQLYKASVFPWTGSGKALTSMRSEGLTKLLFDPNGRIIGGGIVGTHAGDLIGEVALAIEMGCTALDLALTIHPHPTLSESIGVAAEIHEGMATDV
jgi:dihydrolipoamide dehydrogenase